MPLPQLGTVLPGKTVLIIIQRLYSGPLSFSSSTIIFPFLAISFRALEGGLYEKQIGLPANALMWLIVKDNLIEKKKEGGKSRFQRITAHSQSKLSHG